MSDIAQEIIEKFDRLEHTEQKTVLRVLRKKHKFDWQAWLAEVDALHDDLLALSDEPIDSAQMLREIRGYED
ncbi:MAG: hypothetical protein SGJ24_07280 [Chloroflexota bacterium]|nr:hypothetical protein [Chloroflexota bacterium]